MSDVTTTTQSSYCVCPLKGMCERHGYNKTQREHEICQGINISADNAQKYRKAWEQGTFPGRVGNGVTAKKFVNGVRGLVHKTTSSDRLPRIGKPGTELKRLLSWFGKHASTGCGCTNHASMMDQRGCDWCEANVETIVGWLQVEASKSKVLGFSLDMVPGFEIGAATLVRLAISNARVKASEAKLVGVPIDRKKLVTHIVYHVMPLGGAAEWIWRRHIQWLHSVRHQFNGRVIIGIVTKNVKTDKEAYCQPSEVIKACEGLDAEFIEVENDRKKGEGKTFTLMLEQLQTLNPNEVIFYGHCKGVSRYKNGIHEPPHLWAEAMFDLLFRNREAAITALDTSGICGSFRMPGGLPVNLPGVGPFWFFSGTFFAMRSADVFARRWRKLPKHYGCVEQWPRLMFDQYSETACLFFDEVANLYDANYWKSTITPRLALLREGGVLDGVMPIVK